MDLINTGGGIPGDVISVTVIAFLILLAAFIAAIVAIACHYHATRHAYAARARHLQSRTGSESGGLADRPQSLPETFTSPRIPGHHLGCR